jgi:hypothetical protein
MMIEPIGFATLAIGFLCLAWGQNAAATGFLLASLFGSAAALFIGAANIQPGHVALGFAALASLTRRREIGAAMHTLAPFRPGFWLACLVIYGVITAYAFPRLMAGVTDIVPLGTSAFEDTGGVVPLGRVSSNLTQSIYMIANLFCFVTIAAIAASPGGFRAIFTGLMAYAVGNVVLAFIDMATFTTGTQDLLAFMRNARYALHVETEVEGMKRIVGSFTEASSFARSSLGALGFTLTLFLCGVRPVLTGTLSVVLVVLLILSTSSTGLAGTPALLAFVYGTAVMRSLRPGGAGMAAVVALVVPLTALAVGFGVALSPTASATILDYLDLVLFEKPASASAIERGMWNAVAWQNILDTNGFGVGLGTNRTSSFVLALPANVGFIGTILYLAFLVTALGRKRGESRGFHADARLAARNGCVGLLIGDVMVSAFLDQGLFFYALAALAASTPDLARRAARPFTVELPLGLVAGAGAMPPTASPRPATAREVIP